MISPSVSQPLQGVSRRIQTVVPGQQAMDGAGVTLTRLLGTPTLPMVDPFLMLDWFHSDDPKDYIAGFPDHPHRGFETVTYVLAGRVRHEDNQGHAGVIGPGGVQWMTAGRGIVHSEMPEQDNGLLQGFQLWVNLPAADKMIPPRYQEFTAEQIPTEQRSLGCRVKVIAGQTSRGEWGPVQGIATQPIFLDITLAAGEKFSEPVPRSLAGFLAVFEGQIKVGNTQISAPGIAVLDTGDQVEVMSGSTGGRFLVIAGRPLQEPIARYGPFVMTTEAELIQAFRDYETGRL